MEVVLIIGIEKHKQQHLEEGKKKVRRRTDSERVGDGTVPENENNDKDGGGSVKMKTNRGEGK